MAPKRRKQPVDRARRDAVYAEKVYQGTRKGKSGPPCGALIRESFLGGECAPDICPERRPNQTLLGEHPADRRFRRSESLSRPKGEVLDGTS